MISGFELAGQVFFGKEIFVGKLGDLNVAAIVIVDISMPSIIGIDISTNTRSGWISRIIVNASFPLEAIRGGSI